MQGLFCQIVCRFCDFIDLFAAQRFVLLCGSLFSILFCCFYALQGLRVIQINKSFAFLLFVTQVFRFILIIGLQLQSIKHHNYLVFYLAIIAQAYNRPPLLRSNLNCETWFFCFISNPLKFYHASVMPCYKHRPSTIFTFCMQLQAYTHRSIIIVGPI